MIKIAIADRFCLNKVKIFKKNYGQVLIPKLYCINKHTLIKCKKMIEYEALIYIGILPKNLR